ncbi:hypothetical protein NE237_021295 [Protea cynaroides]|uniref:K Homology domain-containing protein n=1 Tax=Protea cynaroides TaxID=273540 RepID=A0A9Q0K483_9MAGN|nr:hypothetical protein NE237_021295 [Protea cynaroides]
MSNMYQSGGTFMGSNAGAPIVGLAPLGPYGGYKGDSGSVWPHAFYPVPRDEASANEFCLHLVCPTGNIGGVIGKGGSIIKQIRQESGAFIKVHSAAADGDDCMATISAKEFFEDPISPTIDAAVHLQPKCSEKPDKDSDPSITTYLLVPISRIGCLIGKGGSIISEMRKVTKANIRILSKENLPKVASEDDELVQITGDLDVARNAIIQVTTWLKANFFEKEGALSAFPPALSYVPLSADISDGSKYGSRDTKSHGRGFSYSIGYGGSSGAGTYGAYGAYSSGRSGSAGMCMLGSTEIATDLADELIGYLSDVFAALRYGSCSEIVKVLEVQAFDGGWEVEDFDGVLRLLNSFVEGEINATGNSDSGGSELVGQL